MSLSWHEIQSAAMVGVVRNIEAMRSGRNSKRLSRDISDWDIHVLGALGECALAKALNVYWGGTVNSFKAADIGGSIQVRTRSRHDYDLIVRDSDSDSDSFVLVTGGPEQFLVRGWISGREAKCEQFRKNYGNLGAAYFVPASRLKGVECLPL